MKTTQYSLGNRSIGSEQPPLFIAELSGNHGHCLADTREMIRQAAAAGADAVKLQTYTPDSLTLPFRTPLFLQTSGLWKGRYLYDMYTEGSIPWEWHQPLAEEARSHGLIFLSTPFDDKAVDLLESLDVPIYKIASHEVVHLPLLERVGKTQKPVLLSTGMANEDEIQLALDTLYNAGTPWVVLLKCISAYPAKQEGFNLLSIQALQNRFGTPVGLSDHTLTPETTLGAIALGACVIEKHFVLSRASGVLDSGFSLEPQELKATITLAKSLWKSLGKPVIGPSEQEAVEQRFRRSIFVSEPIQSGETLTAKNLRIVRPANGLAPKHWDAVLGKQASEPLEPGTPLQWAHINELVN
ncbi:MAG: pseudaminic acid synthase [Verrucomicrobia bacterium 21-51-4]|nr:MAG: pseudaminic acid synthase [Verrucomicrobia bacterium 21-51-4]HQU08989.1 pseudaminic acid synthase [Opitutales bacterium]